MTEHLIALVALTLMEIVLGIDNIVIIKNNPTLKMLALSFLILIGVVLVAEGSGVTLNKGHIYFARAFSLVVEFLNIRVRRSPKKRNVVADQA